MASPIATIPAHPVIVFGPRYVFPHEITLVIKEKFSFSGDDMSICDTSGRAYFKLKARYWSFHNKRCIYDVDDRPVFCVKEKAFSLHNSVMLFHGGEPDDANLACTVKEVIFTLKHQAHITDKSGVIIAEAKRKSFTAASILAGKGTYYVRISPNVDMALIVGLVNVVEEMFVEKN